MPLLDPSRISEIERRLSIEYGQPRHHNPDDPLDDLVFLLLSRMTQEVKYVRTYEALRRTFPTWEDVADSDRAELVAILQDAGLAKTKADHLQQTLREIRRREHKLSLDRLHTLVDEEAEKYLTSLPGVAAKTALCVMLYALGRDVLPVDAHVWRVAQRLGLAPSGPWSERRSRDLEEAVQPGLRASLHVTLIAHGRAVCRARSPHCGSCCLADLCPSDCADKAACS